MIRAFRASDVLLTQQITCFKFKETTDMGSQFDILEQVV